jgi:hypothetical protein
MLDLMREAPRAQQLVLKCSSGAQLWRQLHHPPRQGSHPLDMCQQLCQIDKDAGAIGPSAYLVGSKDSSAALGQLAIKVVRMLMQRALGTTPIQQAGR